MEILFEQCFFLLPRKKKSWLKNGSQSLLYLLYQKITQLSTTTLFQGKCNENKSCFLFQLKYLMSMVLSVFLTKHFHVLKTFRKWIAFLDSRTEFATEEIVLFLQHYQDYLIKRIFLTLNVVINLFFFFNIGGGGRDSSSLSSL